ncbi:GntR family transcriptional regulator [Xanthobacter oligotrophicus]|uniref:GntR family transcriptional regulator n=1 Tax=Xanthobacter oligotrophicus TaxID=2607286 RepID=A0ABW6ZZX1_9HYPH
MQHPRHKTLSDILAREIADGTYPVGGRFPSEHELQARFDVGRHTVREALKTLTEQGMLGRRQKAGTTVLASTPFAHYAHTLRDTSGLFGFVGDTALDVRYLGFVREPSFLLEHAEPKAPTERWLRIAGVRHTRSDGSPLCWTEIYVPSAFPLDREAVRGARQAIYELCMETHNLKLNYVEQEIKATTLPRAIAGLLAAEPESAALLVLRRYVADAGVTFEVSANLYPANRYSVRTIIR